MSLAEAREIVEEIGLVFVDQTQPGITRIPRAKSFSYTSPSGKPIRDKATLERIRAIVIPPAWQNVWISPLTDGYIQATGRDERGRKQYRYHEQWTDHRSSTKYDRLVDFAKRLPTIRAHIEIDLQKRGLQRERVLATVVALLQSTLIRIGNETYARENKSFGLTTLRNKHVAVRGDALRFKFTGKSGKIWNVGINDRRIARIVRSCQELPGQNLFQYVSEAGEVATLTSHDVNTYLRDAAKYEISAKDFRTWTGTVRATMELAEIMVEDGHVPSKRALSKAITKVAALLGNTPAVCRKSYIHPAIIAAYHDGALRAFAKHRATGQGDSKNLTPHERAVVKLLKSYAIDALGRSPA